MPENKKQGFIFGVIMSYAMAFGMEIYIIVLSILDLISKPAALVI